MTPQIEITGINIFIPDIEDLAAKLAVELIWLAHFKFDEMDMEDEAVLTSVELNVIPTTSGIKNNKITLFVDGTITREYKKSIDDIEEHEFVKAHCSIDKFDFCLDDVPLTVTINNKPPDDFIMSLQKHVEKSQS